jgi:flagellar basal body-associated protein FliL
MALSMGGLSGIIIFLITIHMGVALGYHVYMKKKKETEEERKTNTGEKEANEEEIKFIITEKMHGAFR